MIIVAALSVLERRPPPRRARPRGRDLDAATAALAAARVANRASCHDYAEVLRALPGSQWKRSLALLGEMRSDGIKLDSAGLTAAIQSQARGYNWRSAMGLLRNTFATEVAKPNAIHYNVAVGACAAAGRWEEAVQLLRELADVADGAPPRRAHAGAGASPEARAFTMGIEACGKAGQPAAALELLGVMRRVTPPDVVAYNAAIKAMVDSEQAKGLLREMKEHGVPFNRATYTNLIHVLGAARQTGQALAVLDRMPTPDAVAYNAAISACAATGAWEEAIGLLGRMEGAGVAPTVVSYASALGACANGSRPLRGAALFRLMRWRGVRPDAVATSAAITAATRGGRPAAALALFETMRGEGDLKADAVMYNAALHACAVGGDGRAALRLHREMRAEGVAPNDVTYSALLQALWDQPEATVLLEEAMGASSTFRRALRATPASGWLLDLHTFSPGAAVALALWLLSRLCKLETQGAPLPPAVRIVTGWGRHTPSWRGDRAAVRRAVTAALRVCGVPTVAAEGHVEIDVTKLGAWVESAVASGVIRGYFEKEDLWVLDVEGLAAKMEGLEGE